jgi:hypothetical protein
MTFISLVYEKLPYPILANFLGKYNENSCEKAAKERRLRYLDGMFGIS